MQAQRFWTRAYQRNIGKMIGVCYRYVGNRALAEDLAHDAFLKAIEKSESFRRLGSFEGWLMRLNLNNTLDYLRRQPQFQPIEEVEVPESAEMDDRWDEENHTLRADDFTEEDVLEALGKLPDKHRTVFNLYVFEDQKHTKIAELLQIGVRSSKRYLAEARVQLQHLLTDKHHHKKSSIMVLLLLISHRSHAVDRICVTKLKHLSLAPASPSPLGALQWATAPKPSAWLALSAAKAPAIATGVITTAVAGSVAVWQAQPSEPTIPHNPGLPVDTLRTQTIEPQQESDTISVVETLSTPSLQEDASKVSAPSISLTTEPSAESSTPSLSEEPRTTPPSSHHSLTIFLRHGYCGLADEQGNEVVPPLFSHIEPFDEYRSGWAMVDRFGFKGFVDSSGKEVVHPQYDEIGKFGFYRDGCALVRKGNFYGFIDLTGKEVVPVIHKREDLINHH
ncbi:MAG: sigma-70 family RNA polymerase sigma factor [Bacteroidales bacterium]|nr:sigma-70 family RNA polymerase sigma factor [Bacteroidales bacterium]